jgi:2-aminoethylphosphonate-pyruvate transaminase
MIPAAVALLAFHQALIELEEEGGSLRRLARFRANHKALMRGMTEMGFHAYLAPEDQSCIITTFRYPADPGFRFEKFYERLSELGLIIYPGKLTTEPCFRIGAIGQLTLQDISAPIESIDQVLQEMNVATIARGSIARSGSAV